MTKGSPLKTDMFSNWEARHDINNLDNYSSRIQESIVYHHNSQSEDMSTSEAEPAVGPSGRNPPPAVPNPSRKRHSTGKTAEERDKEPEISPIKKVGSSGGTKMRRYRSCDRIPLPLSQENLRQQQQQQQRRRHHSTGLPEKKKLLVTKTSTAAAAPLVTGLKRKRSASGGDASASSDLSSTSPPFKRLLLTKQLDVNRELTPQVKSCVVGKKQEKESPFAADCGGGGGDVVMSALGLMRRTSDVVATAAHGNKAKAKIKAAAEDTPKKSKGDDDLAAAKERAKKLGVAILKAGMAPKAKEVVDPPFVFTLTDSETTVHFFAAGLKKSEVEEKSQKSVKEKSHKSNMETHGSPKKKKSKNCKNAAVCNKISNVSVVKMKKIGRLTKSQEDSEKKSGSTVTKKETGSKNKTRGNDALTNKPLKASNLAAKAKATLGLAEMDLALPKMLTGDKRKKKVDKNKKSSPLVLFGKSSDEASEKTTKTKRQK
jgi:hypothetical protein